MSITIIKSISYAPEHGMRGLGDLYLPSETDGAPVALVIHGGGWGAMDKHGLAGVAEFLAEQGFVAYAINYRLIGTTPWPACGDDCLRAAEFLLEADIESLLKADRRQLLVIGASAGGHLALMTGLRLPAKHVRAIVSIAGPSDLAEFARDHRERSFKPAFWNRFFGCSATVTPAMLKDASAVSYVGGASPPLLCMHSTRDQLVRIEQSELIVDAYREHGANAVLFPFEGNDINHGIWVPGSDPHRLLPILEQELSRYLHSRR